MLPSSIADRPLRVALSGGGFRAALFSLGSMLYLVDTGLNARVSEIRSVSGASILNGLLAQSGNVQTMGVSDIDDVAITLLRTVTRRGLLQSSLVIPLYLVTIIAGAALIAAAGLTGWPVAISSVAGPRRLHCHRDPRHDARRRSRPCRRSPVFPARSPIDAFRVRSSPRYCTFSVRQI